MDFVLVKPEQFEQLAKLQIAYKNEIGEERPDSAQLERLKTAIELGKIDFYGCVCDDELVACCSICRIYSTFDYGTAGVFEDFYILPAYRHRGIARKLVSFAFTSSGVTSLTVGCAACDIGMYNALGFDIPLGNMFAYHG